MNLKEATQKFKQAVDLFEKNEFDQAREISEQLIREINSNLGQQFQKVYVSLQVILGGIYQYQGEIEKAIVAYRYVPKEETEYYAIAQFSLGNNYREQG